jgi:hypothetical protein
MWTWRERLAALGRLAVIWIVVCVGGTALLVGGANLLRLPVYVWAFLLVFVLPIGWELWAQRQGGGKGSPGSKPRSFRSAR